MEFSVSETALLWMRLYITDCRPKQCAGSRCTSGFITRTSAVCCVLHSGCQCHSLTCEMACYWPVFWCGYNHCQHLWQAEWDGCVLNKLGIHSVKPLFGYSNLSSLSRQDAVVLRRLRIGHIRLTHSYLLNRHCDCVLTVAHVLLECNHYNVVRQRYFNVSSLRELFDTVNAQNIVGFIRDIGLYPFIVSCNLTFIHPIDFITATIFKPIVNT